MSLSDSKDSSVRQPEAGWIGKALKTSLKSLHSERLGDGRGLQSTAWKLFLEAEPGYSCPESLILKSETSDPTFNELSSVHNAFGREVGVYEDCLSALKNHHPKIYASQGESPSWLLMEDLSHLRGGDQVIGLTFEETLASIRSIAAIHATFWMDSSLKKHAWLPKHGFWFSSPKPEIIDDFFATYGVRFGTEACQLYRAVLEQSRAIDAALDRRPWTLVHGDLRADNLLFDGQADNPRSVVLDWSWVTRSAAAIDLAFLISGSTPQSQRHNRHSDFLETWHQELMRHGVSDYPLEMAWRDLRLAALRCMTAGDAMHGFTLETAPSTRVALFMDDAIQRHAAYALEIEAWRALPDPSAGADFE